MRFQGRCFRAHHPAWAYDPTSGEGARLTGGRFNRKGTEALYLSLRLETAVGECSQGFAHRIPPMTLCEYEVDVDPVADLASGEGRDALGIRLEELACPWLALTMDGQKAPSQEVAERLEHEGFAGALVPSFIPGAGPEDVNLVLWKWGSRRPRLVRVHDPEGRLVKVARREG